MVATHNKMNQHTYQHLWQYDADVFSYESLVFTIYEYFYSSCHYFVLILCVYVLYIMYCEVLLLTDSFLKRFPYCLPSMFSALLSVTGVITVGCLLPPNPENKL